MACGTIGLSFKHFGRRCLGHPGGAQTRTATVAQLELEPFVTRLRCQDLLRPLQRLQHRARTLHDEDQIIPPRRSRTVMVQVAEPRYRSLGKRPMLIDGGLSAVHQ